MNSPEMVGIGVSVFDLVMVVNGFPREETVVQAISNARGIGGGVAVAMATASVMGVATAVGDRLGTDVISDSIMTELSSAGVDISGVQRSDEVSPSLATIWVNQAHGSRTIVFAPGRSIDLSWNDQLAEKVSSAKLLHLNGRHLSASLQAMEVAKQSGTKVSYDGGAHRYRREVLPLVEQSDILIVSEHFACEHVRGDSTAVVSRQEPADLCQRLRKDFSAEIVGVTCGDRGSWFATDPGDAWHQAAHPAARVRDTTGCGDTFHGAFLAAMLRGMPLRRCTQIASQVAAHQAESLGAFSPTVAKFASLIA